MIEVLKKLPGEINKLKKNLNFNNDNSLTQLPKALIWYSFIYIVYENIR